MKIRFKLLIILMAVPFIAQAQADSIKNYLSSALNIMKNKSVNKGSINWEKVYQQADEEVKTAKTIRDTYPIIRKALDQLKDSHSKLYLPEQVSAYLLGYRATGQQFPVITSKIIDNKYAYITLPDIGSFNQADWNEYVDTFYQKVKELQKSKPKGWIIDLRENFGGMLYPMYASISVFIDQKNATGSKDADGKISFFNYKNQKLYEGKDPIVFLSPKEKQPKKIKAPIAVLISKKTASSGEFITAAFVGQKNVKLIGENTQGLTSSNQEYKLSDNAFLVLTIGNTIDRHQKEYNKVGAGLSPDIKVDVTRNKEENNKMYLDAAKRAIDQFAK